MTRHRLAHCFDPHGFSWLGWRPAALAVVLWILAGCAAPVQARQPGPPPPPLPETAHLAPNHARAGPRPSRDEAWPEYQIQAEIRPGSPPQVVGQEILAYPNTTGLALDELVLRLYPNLPAYGGRLETADITVNGQPVTTTLSHLDSALHLILPRPLEPDATALVRLHFTATLPTRVMAGVAGQGIYGYVGGIYDLADFYPMLAVHDGRTWRIPATTVTFGDAAFSPSGFYRVALTVPPDHQVAATGMVLQRRSHADGRQTWQLAAGPVRAFYAAVSERFQVLSQTVGGVRVYSYYLPGNEAGARQALETAAQALQIFGQLFGPYPHRELEIVPMPTTGYGMEHAEVIALAPHLYRQGVTLDLATVHEVAHQWWYDLVGNDPVNEPWLDEALADYSVVLYYEALGDSNTAAWLLARYREQVQTARQWGRDRPVVGPLDRFGLRQYLEVVYAKGALFFHQVRARMGAAAFQAALRDYAQEYRHQVATGPDLLRVLQRHSPVPLDDLVLTWLGPVSPAVAPQEATSQTKR